jgi:hypothetical protein
VKKEELWGLGTVRVASGDMGDRSEKVRKEGQGN